MANGLDDKWFPSITNPQNAAQAMHNGACIAGLCAAIRIAINVAAIYAQHPIMGVSGWGLIDGVLLAVAAWRVYRLSLPWAIAGLVLYILGRIVTMVNHPQTIFRVVFTVMVLPYFWNAVRGGLYLGRTRTRATDSAPIPEAVATEAFKGETVRKASGGSQRSLMPESSIDEYSEFLECMRRGERKFQKLGRTVHEEFAAWLKDRHRRLARADH
jgi:hypothetical protein